MKEPIGHYLLQCENTIDQITNNYIENTYTCRTLQLESAHAFKFPWILSLPSLTVSVRWLSFSLFLRVFSILTFYSQLTFSITCTRFASRKGGSWKVENLLISFNFIHVVINFKKQIKLFYPNLSIKRWLSQTISILWDPQGEAAVYSHWNRWKFWTVFKMFLKCPKNTYIHVTYLDPDGK